MNSAVLVNVIRFFSKGHKCLLTFLRVLKQVLKEENLSLSCLDQMEMDVEMSAAPLGCDYPDAPWIPKLQEYEKLICESESFEILSRAVLEKMLKKSFDEFGKLYPELALAPQQVGLLLRPILLGDSNTSTLSTIAVTEGVPASVPSSASTEFQPSPLISSQTSFPLLGGKRGPTYDPSLEVKSKVQKISTLPIYSSKYNAISSKYILFEIVLYF
jgi:hypothetical protein